MPARTVTVTGLGDLKAIEEAFRKAGYVVDDTADQMVASVKRAGAAAAEQAKQMGASADEQAAAAGRAAAAFDEAQASMTRSQRVAASAAAGAAKAAGLSADEQQAAYERASAAAKASADAQEEAAARVRAAQDAHTKLVGTMSKIGGATLIGLAAGGVAAIKLGADFETAGARIKGATGQSEAAIQKVTGAFQGTAGKFESSGQAMESAYAGVAGQLKLTEGHALSAAQALKFQSAATDLNTAAGGELNATTSALASVMQAYHVQIAQSTQASDELFNVSKGLNVPLESVAGTVDKLHGRLGALVPSMSAVGGLMLDLGAHGIQGSRGALIVNSALQTLTGGSKKTDEVLQALGVHVYDSQGKFVGLSNVIAQLHGALATATPQEQHFAEQALFGKGAVEVLGGVVQRGAGDLQHYEQAVTKTGTAHEAAKAKSETLVGELHTLGAAIDTAGGKFGTILIPEVKAAGAVLEEGTKFLVEHKAAAVALGVVISGVLGTAVAVFAYTKAVAFVGATKDMIGAMGSLAAKLGLTSTAVEGSFAAQATAAETAAGATAAAEEGLAAKVAASDDAIVASNEAAGASFTAMLGPIGAVVAALAAAQPLINKLTGGGLNEPKDTHEAGLNKAWEAQYGPGGKYGPPAPLGSPKQYGEVAGIAQKYGVSPHTLWGIYGTETTYGKNIATSSTGAEGGFQFEPETAKTYGYPLTNHPNAKQFAAQAEAAARYIATMTRKYGSEAKAVEAYYAGHPGGQSEYLHKVEAAGGAHYGRAQEEELKKNATSGGAGKKLQALMEEASGAKAKKTAAALGIPTAVATMLSTAQALLGAKYTSGGGHGSSANDPIEMLKKIGVDCSGFVSRVLSSGGLPTTGLTTEGLASSSALSKGAGRYVTVFDRANAGANSHAIIDILGHYFESGGNPKYNPRGGVSLLTAAQAKGELGSGGFVAYHPNAVNTPVKGGLNASALGTGLAANEAEASAFEKLIKEREAAVKKAETKGLTTFRKYETELQTGSVKPLEKLVGTHQQEIYRTYLPAAQRVGTTTLPGGEPQNKEFGQLVSALRATHQKALEELASKLVTVHAEAEAELSNELKAEQETADARTLALQTTEAKDQTTIVSDMAANVVQAMKDAAQQITDSFAAAATAIKDQTKEMADASSAQVTKIQAESQLAVDKLGERGLYGLNLVAQQQQVALDELKIGYGSQIAQAQQALDTAQTQTDNAAAAQQALVDAVTINQDALVGQAQQNLDNVTKTVDARVQEAQNEVAKAATGSQAQQQIAQAHLVSAEAAANAAVQQAQAALSEAQSHAAQAEQEAQSALASAQGNAQVVLAQAEQALTQAQDQANVSEAEQQAIIEKTKAEAATQYAGSGLVVNITGINPSDSAAIASEMGWILRTQIPAVAPV